MNEPTVEWYVRINSSLYSVTYRGPGEGWRLVQLEGPRPGATYDIRIKDGVATCTCPDGSNHRYCKHARALETLGHLLPRNERSAG